MSTQLYLDDLYALQQLLDYVEKLSQITGVFSMEIRVKFDDTDTWAIVGWGESGDPAFLRFEQDPKPVVVHLPSPFTINQ